MICQHSHHRSNLLTPRRCTYTRLSGTNVPSMPSHVCVDEEALLQDASSGGDETTGGEETALSHLGAAMPRLALVV
jgi:hypothetical protein